MAAYSKPKALLSVFYKDNLTQIAQALVNNGYDLLSTGGTRKHLTNAGFSVEAVEDLTSYPSILGGRVKTLHPKVFGGILSRRSLASDQEEMAEFAIPAIDVVVVDLYPFSETVKAGGSHQDSIEKIDIGGISLIRAAAKNYKDCWIIPSTKHYQQAIDVLNNGQPSEEIRKQFAAEAFKISSHYDIAIQAYLSGSASAIALGEESILRYGENPHQKGSFYGQLNDVFEKLHGRELSYNNLLDADAAVNLIKEFDETTVAVLKHNNACGLASRDTVLQSWIDALAGDPVSAFGGVLIANVEVDAATAQEMHGIFFEIVIAPSYSAEALEILKQKKNRIILVLKNFETPKMQYRSLLNGILAQEKDLKTDNAAELEIKTDRSPTSEEIDDLIFASKICKHTKSNTIILAKNKQLLAGGTGQTSRVDALTQAIVKAKAFKFSLENAVMASDAFFPFPDCVEIAQAENIKAVIQPGGSIKDQLSIDYCNTQNMAMVFTGTRHFKH
jgi:phosphoribosylaminoimidazolecarboxamide formyltransferase/IMP cyclohydrolase